MFLYTTVINGFPKLDQLILLWMRIQHLKIKQNAIHVCMSKHHCIVCFKLDFKYTYYFEAHQHIYGNNFQLFLILFENEICK